MIPYMKYPKHLIKVIEVLKRLPGVGNKSAERYAFQLLDWKPQYLEEMAEAIRTIPEKLKHCDECGCLRGDEPCSVCVEPRTQSGVICLVASSKDALAVEETRQYKGLYHVLGGLLSPMEGVGPEKLNLPKLKERIDKLKIQELILGLDSTLEGDATSLYIKRELSHFPIKISRLAFGIPMGSSLDYIDGGTLSRALSGRATF
jgi:recombination protein RecR